MSKTLKKHCRYKCKFLNTKAYWIIDNAADIHKDIEKINIRHKAKSINSYDFAQLYTNIPHDKLRESIKFVLAEAFQIKDSEDSELYIKINKKNATWSRKLPKKSKLLHLDKDQIMKMFNYLMDNIYLFYRTEIYRQIIGIPMGTDCAPELANLFLFSYEYIYIIDLINSGVKDIDLFRYIYRYIDDLLSLNDKRRFNAVFKDIYPSELELKKTALSHLKAAYLDMDITVNQTNKQFHYTLYDKRNDFSFKVISMPNLKSNIPISPAYGVFYSQVVRLFRANNNLLGFINNVKALSEKLCNQNFNKANLFHQLNLFRRPIDQIF